MKVEILYFEGCPNHAPTVQRVREAADALGVDVEVIERNVGEIDDAASVGFRGSPTVLVAGREVEPGTGEATSSAACRTFSSGTGVPDRAVIEKALRDNGG